MLMFLRGFREGLRADRGWRYACERATAFHSAAYWRGARFGAWLAGKVA